MSSSVDKIKDKLDIVEVVGSYIKIEKSGSNYKAKCPFHNEKTPSFFLSPDRGYYYCFGCSAKGDMFNFVQEFEGLDFMGALKVLAGKAGIDLSNESFQVKDEKTKLYSALETASLFFQRELLDCTEAKNYLLKRGLKEETIREWNIGYSKSEWRVLYNYLKTKKFTDFEIEKAGLIKKSGNTGSGQEYYDVFRGRIMFPIFDSSGRIVAFSGRILLDDGKSPKYLNSPDTILFNKSETLYGLHKAKSEIRKKDYSILVEGQMDLLMCHQAGFGNAIASSGTALTERHLERLKRLSNKIVMSFDSDKAGFAAADRGAKLALSLGMEVKVVQMANGFDPADQILKDPKGWVEALKNSKHIIDFHLDNLLSSGMDARKIGLAIKEKILPYVQMLQSNIEKSYYVSDISKKANIKEEAIWEDLKKVNMPEIIPEKAVEAKVQVLRKDSIEKKILGIIFWQSGLEKPMVESKNIEKKFKEIIGQENFEKLLNLATDQKEAIIFEVEAYYDKRENLAKDLEELFHNLEEDYLKHELNIIMKEQSEAERMKDEEKRLEFLGKAHEVSKKLDQLKRKSQT